MPPLLCRCGGILDELPEVSGHAIVLAYAPQDRQQAAEAVALYLHLYCGLELEQAAQVREAVWQARFVLVAEY